MIILFKSVLNFIKNPRLKPLKHATFKQKMALVLQCIPLCIMLGLGFGLLTIILEALGLYSSDSHSINKLLEEQSKINIILSAVILAPVLEELIFRGPMTLFNKKYFKLGFYMLTIIFGYVHIFNFEVTPQILLLSPLLIAPQLVVGSVFGYVRVRLGLIYSMFLHASYNGILVIPAVLFLDK
tara:strand:- start:2674 stop:3222 length:549 start_codon:yes stop_codon:yes gene_type:complete